MRRILLAVSLFATLDITVPASAESKSDQTVQTLYEMCKEPIGGTKNSICIGYVSGIGSFMRINGVAKLDPAYSICGEPSYGAMVQAFQNWAATHPEDWDDNQATGVALALREKWPCSAGKRN